MYGNRSTYRFSSGMLPWSSCSVVLTNRPDGPYVVWMSRCSVLKISEMMSGMSREASMVLSFVS